MHPFPFQLTTAYDAVLVSCYELGHEPLGALTPAGVLDRAGFAIRVIDVAVDDFDPAIVVGVPLIAISTPMHTALRLGAQVAARVRAVSPTTHICFYGLYAELHRTHLVPALADTCLGAECEADLVTLVRAIRDRTSAWPRDIALAHVPRAAALKKERALDLAPRRTGARISPRYARLYTNGEYHDAGYVATTRGCKHTCRHCPIPAAYHGRFYALPVSQVLADIDAVVASGARHVTFADADFLNGPTHALRIAREMHRRHPTLTFDYTAKIEHLRQHPAVVDELQSLGNVFVVSAVESFNDEVLRHLDKGHSADEAIEVIRAFEKRALSLRPSLMPFTPWETRASLGHLFDVIAAEGLVDGIDPVQYSIRLLLPAGSLLMRDPDLTVLTGAFDPARFTYEWSHPDPAMDELQRHLAAISAQAADEDVPAVTTFVRMAALVAPGRVPRVRRRQGDSPRLTEDWFC